jgi:PAS domain S-box-containing protein
VLEPSEVLMPLGAVKAAGWFFENSLDVFLGLEDGLIRSANATWTRLTGWEREELIGSAYHALIHPDDVETATASAPGPLVGDRSVCDYRLATKDGGWMWVRSHAVRGDKGWLLAILRDVTAEREREVRREEARRTAAMLRDAAGVTVWRYNPEADEYDLDPGFTDQSEASEPRQILTGTAMRPAVHREDAPALNAAWMRTLTTGEPCLMSYRERTADKGWRHIRASWQGLRPLASGHWEVLGISQDVTALIIARDAALRGEQAALAAVEAKALFLANISHEIRTPMNGVLGILHLLAAEPSREQRVRLVREALASGVGLSDLLNDIIDYSDVESGRLELNPAPMDPATEIESVLALLRPQALAKGLDLKSHVEGEVGWVAGDAARLRKMAFHLVANAVKFTTVGGVQVKLSARGEGSARRLKLEVIDTGVGIPASVQAGLFERFSQGDGSSTRRFGGVGLGLAVTKRLAELMDGRVGYLSVEGEGARFWFEIAAPERAAPRDAPEPEGGWLSGLRVLVVEDNPTNRLVATTMLRQLGAEVETADDGAQGLAAVQRSNFDLIFMDIQMPVMDGVEATRRIRALAPPKCQTPIVATTANVMPDQLLTYRQSGINGVVAKPISPQALLAEVARVADAA